VLKAGLNTPIHFPRNPLKADVPIYQVIISPAAERASTPFHSIPELYVCVNKQLESRDNGAEGDLALRRRRLGVTNTRSLHNSHLTNRLSGIV
jgi:hypothetical protein